MPAYQKKDELVAIDTVKEFNERYKKRRLDPGEDISKLSLSDLDPE